ncbi:MAG: phage tail tape measure protein, partial [Anaerolineae bacterium]|nr:phage tail tape measure protein [Anaerolineae bacterium]
MLLNMSEDTVKTKAAWAELGTSLYDSQGNMRNLNTVIKELDTALDRLPVEDQNRLMQQLGGSYGIVGLNALRAAGGIDTMLGAMGAAPDAASVAMSFMDTFKGKLESLQGSIETLMIEAFTPYMNDVLAPMIERKIEMVNAITKWVQANPELTKTILRVAGALITLGPTLIIVGKTMAFIGAVGAHMGLIFGLLFSPITLAAAAIGAVIYALDQLGFLSIDSILDNIGDGFRTLIGVLGRFNDIVGEMGIGRALAAVINAFMQMLGLVEDDQMAQAAICMGDGIVTAFLTVAAVINRYVLPPFRAIWNFFAALASGQSPIFAAMVLLSNFFPAATAVAIIGRLLEIRQAVSNLIDRVREGLGALDLSDLKDRIVGGIKNAFNAIRSGDLDMGSLSAALRDNLDLAINGA